MGAHAGDMAKSLRTGDIWGKSRQELAEGMLRGVIVREIDKNSIRVPQDGGLTWEGLEYGESILYWDEEGCLAHIDVMVYNKGDDGELGIEGYYDALSKATQALNRLAKGKGKACKVSQKNAGVKLNAWVWEWEGGAARLETSSRGKKKDFAAEFIRLKLGRGKEALERGGARDSVRRNELKAHVKKEGSAVWIEGVNMVDQGKKGYCVPATVARVFAYYGMDGVDQHALAQLCNSSADGGTSPWDMQRALADISQSFHFKLVNIDGAISLSGIEGEYNKAAKKMKKEPLSEDMDFDATVLLAARAGKPAQVKKWLEPIRKSIDIGQPVLWGVLLGIFPEEGLNQNRGGHMRLIIGYDTEEKVIYYSDSWGAGHERKKMPADQACAITAGRYLLKK